MSKEVLYTLSFKKPYTHYCEVEIFIRGVTEDTLTIAMPVWTPGSYLIREFSKNVEGVIAEDSTESELMFAKPARIHGN